jgi:hypothetical protein
MMPLTFCSTLPVVIDASSCGWTVSRGTPHYMCMPPFTRRTSPVTYDA